MRTAKIFFRTTFYQDAGAKIIFAVPAGQK